MDAQTTRKNDITFWANRFAEHCRYAQVAMLKSGLQPPNTLSDLQNQWLAVANDPSSLFPQLIVDSLDAKQQVKATLQQAGAPCWPSLMQHMMEEMGSYFVPAILQQQMTFAQEAAFWSNEHRENLLFVNCELPVLLAQDASMTPPTPQPSQSTAPSLAQQLQLARNQNKQLAQRFAQLGHRLQNVSIVSQPLYDSLMQLCRQHLSGVHQLILRVPDLPLTADDQRVTWELLQHEQAESEFAIARLRRLWDQQQCQPVFRTGTVSMSSV